MAGQPSPLGSLCLFGFVDRRLDLVLTLVLLAVVAISRLAAFPASIWEQDEAYLAAAVVHFDPAGNAPHPPWFPLWIALGRLVHLTGVAAAPALQVVGLAASVWILFPLTSLWSKLLPRSLAPAAALLFLAAPGPWLLSGRAFTGTTATALLAAALALWLQADERSSRLIGGALFAGLAVGVRPQLAAVVLVAALIVGRRAAAKQRWLAAVVLGGLVLLWALVPTVAAGGPGPLWISLTEHAVAHASQLDEAVRGLAGSGLARSLGGTAPAVVWLILFHLGMIRLFRSRGWGTLSPMLAGVLLPLLVVTYLLSNPAHARYAVPMLAFTAGFVVAGLELLLRRWTWLAVAGLAAVAAAVVVPQLAAYRTAVSPPVAGLEAAVAAAEVRAGVLVVDPALHAFWLLRQAEHPIPVAVIFDHHIPDTLHDPDTPAGWVFLVDATGGRTGPLPRPLLLFSTSIPLVRTLAQDRFLEVAVVEAVRTGPSPRRGSGTDPGRRESDTVR
ncbi:MAG TPA: hypothetical protein VLT32_00190 [Candidatus Sulfomarinibacteraceae bacterium]|nr:hypothetical protein [Candidatus Sulfomarinibacteraceae bacterium]